MRGTYRSDRQLPSVESFSTPWQVKKFVPSWGKQGNFHGVLEKFDFKIDRLTKVGTNHINS